jgi:hypothetical protein
LAPAGWLEDGLLSPVGDLLVDTTAKLPAGKPALLILAAVEWGPTGHRSTDQPSSSAPLRGASPAFRSDSGRREVERLVDGRGAGVFDPSSLSPVT